MHINVAPLESDSQSSIAPIHRHFPKTPFLPKRTNCAEYCEDVLNLQIHGLLRRWQHTHAESLVIGISGGLDSTLALLVCVLTADRLGYSRSQVIGVTMPGFGTSDRTYNNAIELMGQLGISIH